MVKENLLIAIGGATGSGKTALVIQLAKEMPNLVVLSADSRQIYKKLDVGSAKVGSPDFDMNLTGKSEPVWKVDGIPQFLIDIAEPGKDFTLVDYDQEARRLIIAAWEKGKIPLVVGGTGLYIQALVEGFAPNGEVDDELRAKLESCSLDELQVMAKTNGALVAATDWQNKRRVIRAIERLSAHGESNTANKPITSNVRVFVLDRPWEEQRELAPSMVDERLELGLIAETKQLLDEPVDASWLHRMGLSYRLVMDMLNGKFPDHELRDRMVYEFRQLMRRQRTWFRNRMPYAVHASASEITSEIHELYTGVLMGR
jgi:tRNA dimethylallyltransferase